MRTTVRLDEGLLREAKAAASRKGETVTALIERGLVAAGQRLVDARRRHAALVRPDGAVALGDVVGSIHRVGAVAQGLEACNGWTFWHVETPAGLTLIDTLRAQVRAEMGAE